MDGLSLAQTSANQNIPIMPIIVSTINVLNEI